MGHSRNPGYTPGDHWVECMVCGFEYRNSVMKERWDQLIVCPQDYEQRHPQDFVRGVEDDQAAKGLVNPSTEPNYTTDISLAWAWDISVGEYAGKSFDASSEDSVLKDVTFSSDGTKAYTISNASFIYQYTLSTAWDISTASYASKSYEASEATLPTGLSFSSDGTKAYALSPIADRIYQYTLSTAWDISTASYASKSFSVAAQDGAPVSIHFKPDGSVVYVVGYSTDFIYQYTLSTAWDISTASYASKSFSVVNEESFPTGLSLSSDGTKAYIAGIDTDSIYQYTLSTAWDISTASYASKSLYIFNNENNIQGIYFKPDGTTLYIIGTGSDTIYQYSLLLVPTPIPSGTFTL